MNYYYRIWKTIPRIATMPSYFLPRNIIRSRLNNYNGIYQKACLANPVIPTEILIILILDFLFRGGVTINDLDIPFYCILCGLISINKERAFLNKRLSHLLAFFGKYRLIDFKRKLIFRNLRDFLRREE